MRVNHYWGWVLLLLLTCSGCMSGQQPGGKVRLELWTISLKPKFTEYMDRVIADFEGEHPEVEVEWSDLPQANIQQKLMASIAGDASPDVVNLTTANALALARQGALTDVNQQLPVHVKEAYLPNLWQASEFDGGIYALPWYVSTRVLIYNSQLLSRCGLEPNFVPQTWNDVARVAAAVRTSGRGYGYEPVIRLLDDWRMNGIAYYDRQSGKAAFASPAACLRLAWYNDLYKKGLIPPECLSEGYRGALDRYKAGNLAILEAGPQLLLEIKADAGSIYSHTRVSPLPLGAAKVLPASLMNVVVPRASRHRQEALALAAFLTNAQNQLAFAKIVPLLPSAREAANDAFFQRGTGEPLMDQAVRISLAQLTKAVDCSLSLPHNRDLERCVNEAVENTLYGRLSPQEALQQASLRWNLIMGIKESK